ncbi:MAG: glycine oxidase ThiO [Proteobacteria bacterium]|nr:glycine oxidase ThiO [Pseudomonadota bacterium]
MIAIIGGGVCGLGIGWRLAQAGRAVTVLDRGRAGAGASWAAAGMLAPQVEAEPSEEPLLALTQESRGQWPDFAAEVEAASGISVGYRREGTLVVALDRDDVEHLRHRYDYQTSLGLDLEWITGAEARRREPHLARGVGAAVFSALDHQVDNRLLCDALREAYLRAGGVLREHTAVLEILHGGGRVAGLRLADETLEADTVIVAAGPWSRDIPGLPEALKPPVRPLKGQMLALQMPRAAPLLDHVVWGPDIYLVPRGDGRLLIGATVEEMGFDANLTAGGMMDLLRDAWEILPGVYDLPLVESWVGFRPASRDDAPILGATAMAGLIMATGHHRNGILLAPITAEAVARQVLTGRPLPGTERFGIDRFQPGEAAA